MFNSTRRRVLFGGLTIPFLGSVLPWRQAWSSPAVASHVPLLRSRLQEVLNDLDAARDVGHQYVASHPADVSLAQLTEGLLTDDALKNAGSLVERIAALRVRDFENDDTVCVGGWVLARVEARVCALVCQI